MLRRNRSNFLAGGIVLAACLSVGKPAICPAGSLPYSVQKPSSSWNELTPEQWAKDLDFLGAELPKKHKNLFHRISETEFRARIEELKAKLPALGPDETLAGLMKIVAAVGDSHTTVGYRPQQGLPLMLYWFKDGISIVNTTAEYKDILYGKITAFEGKPIEDVVAAVSALIPHENEAQVKNHLPNLLTDIVLLHGLGLIPSQAAASLTVLTEAGRMVTLEMKPLLFSSKPEWLVNTSDESGAPLYLKNRRLFYWYEILPDSRVLFFKYNSCQDMKDQPFSDFIKKLFADVDAAKVEKIIVDLRHNGGGNSAIFARFLEELKKRPALLRKGRIYVLVGRRTFSSAILNALDLKKETPAVFAGEPTGGKPNHYGEIQSFRLPQSGLAVTYSVKYFQVIDSDPDSLVPDILVEPALADYLKKTDPVLDRVLAE
jgi:hypothetical protein